MVEKDNTKFMRNNYLKFLEVMENGTDDEKEIAKVVNGLTRYRIEKNMNQKTISEKSGLSMSVISKIESFQSYPSFKTVLKYSKSLGLELGFAEVK